MIPVILPALALLLFQCIMGMYYLIQYHRGNWQLVIPYLEPVRLRNRFVIGFEWGLIWIFEVVWLLSGEDFYSALALMAFVCLSLAIVLQLLIKFLYHQSRTK